MFIAQSSLCFSHNAPAHTKSTSLTIHRYIHVEKLLIFQKYISFIHSNMEFRNFLAESVKNKTKRSRIVIQKYHEKNAHESLEHRNEKKILQTLSLRTTFFLFSILRRYESVDAALGKCHSIETRIRDFAM